VIGVDADAFDLAVGKMRIAESKMWNQICGMTLIGRDRWLFVGYHTSLSTGSAVKCRPEVRKILPTMAYSVFQHESTLSYFTNVFMPYN